MATPEESPPKVPVTVITGFLGAGKTTFIKYVLTADHGKRVAVIQNEFADEMGIESPMMTDSSGKEIDLWELPNGCICCNVRDDLIGALDAMLQVRDKFDYVLVETTGLADPEPVAEVFWVDDGVESRVFLDGIVTMVDGENIMTQLGSDAPSIPGHDLGCAEEASKQIAFANRVLINKKDLLSDEQVDRLEREVRKLNPTAPIIVTERAQATLENVLNIGGYSMDTLDLGCSDPSHASCSHDKGPVHGVMSVTLTATDLPPNGLDIQKVKQWMSEILWEQDAGHVYRLKAIFWSTQPEEDAATTDTKYCWGLQGVGQLFEIDTMQAVPDLVRFLFIGKDLNRERLEERLKSCYSSE